MYVLSNQMPNLYVLSNQTHFIPNLALVVFLFGIPSFWTILEDQINRNRWAEQCYLSELYRSTGEQKNRQRNYTL